MADIVTDYGVNYNWKAYKNGHNTFTITFTSGGSTFDLSTYVFTLSIRTPGGDTNKLQLTEGSGLTNGGATGILTVALTQTQASTTLPRADYFYELTFVKDSLTYRIIEGGLTLSSETNPASASSSLSISISLAGTAVTAAITIPSVTSAIVATALGYTPANIDSPEFTGTPTSPTAEIGTNTTQIATTEFVHLNTMFKVAGAGEVFPNGLDNAYRLEAYLGAVKPKPLEFFNIGVTAFAGDDRQQVVTGFGKANWSVLTTWNMKVNNANNAWEYGDPNYAQSCIEAGAEGITLHAVPAGTHFSNTWHEMFQVRADGVEGGGTQGPTSGTYLHAKTVLYFRYKSALYDGDEHPWSGGNLRQSDPFIHLHTTETKGTEGEAIRLEANHTTGGTGLQIHFKKSGGNYFSKTAAAINTVAGVINWQIHDGTSYQGTARIYAQATAAATAGTAPQKIVFQTSATNTAGLATRMEIMPDGGIVMHSLPTSDPAVAGELWNDSGTIKISAG